VSVSDTGTPRILKCPCFIGLQNKGFGFGPTAYDAHFHLNDLHINKRMRKKRKLRR
jgi:hypothetical protein